MSKRRPVLASLQAAVDAERALCQERGHAWRTDALEMAQRRAGEAEARLAEARKAHKAQLTTAAAAVAESREETNRAQRASLSELQERLTEAASSSSNSNRRRRRPPARGRR